MKFFLRALMVNFCLAVSVGAEDPADRAKLLDALRSRDEALWGSFTVSVEVRSAAAGWPFFDPKQGMMTRTCTLTSSGNERGMTSLYKYDSDPIFSPLGTCGYRAGDYDEHGDLFLVHPVARYALFAHDLNDMLEIAQGHVVSPDGVIVQRGSGSPTLHRFPVGNEGDFFRFNRILLALGRGFGRRIERITEIRPLEGPLIEVRAKERYGTWTLTVDPTADYIVTVGALVSSASDKAWLIVTTSGSVESDGISIAARGTVIIPTLGFDPSLEKEEVTVTAFSHTASKSHLAELRRKITGALPRGSPIIDLRVKSARGLPAGEDR